MFESAKGSESARTWSSLYQQRPTPQGSNRFHESMFHFYKEGEQPPHLAMVGASDHAVTEGKNDFSEAGVFGVDTRGELWERDWFSEQCNTAVAANKVLDMCAKHGVHMWFNEGGVIDKAMRPLFNMCMRDRQRAPQEHGAPVYVDIRAIPSMQDKVAKCSAFQGRAASGGEMTDGSGRFNHGTIHFRDNANSRRIVQQLVSLPAGRYDDAADVCCLIGRALDQFPIAYVPPSTERAHGPKPFTGAWLESGSEDEKPKVRWR